MQIKIQKIPSHIVVDNKERPTTNNLGHYIHCNVDGIKNFWSWYKGSKLVDTLGRPIIMYHGTNRNFRVVNILKGAQHIFWISRDDHSIESGEAGASSSKVIMELYIKLERPASWREYEKLGLGQLRTQFDGALLDKDAFVFDASQIKSSKNKGTFDPYNKLITE